MNWFKKEWKAMLLIIAQGQQALTETIQRKLGTVFTFFKLKF
jgi:hypothetical protein